MVKFAKHIITARHDPPKSHPLVSPLSALHQHPQGQDLCRHDDQ
ncbi:hypothetical protein [Moraxella lacunata]